MFSVFGPALAVATEARLSIRASIEAFIRISKYIENNPTPIFEVRCLRANVGSMLFDEHPSCGNTLNSFASLFLARSQISHGNLDALVNGNALHCLWRNPNVLMHGLRRFVFNDVTVREQEIIGWPQQKYLNCALALDAYPA